MKAVLDRLVDGKKAVLLVGELEQEYVIDAGRLPLGSREGTVLDISMSNGTVTEISIDLEATQEAEERIQDKLARLRANQSSKFRQEK